MGVRGVRLCALLCSAAAVWAGPASAQQPASELDEVVVTGSFIKRSEGFQAASPVDVLGVEQIQSRPSTNVANFFAELPYNFGSAFSTGRALGGGERGLGTINLRGLGAAATLVLLNGHRQTQVADSPDNIIDVNSLVPDIMIERFEVLKDGASALYGTDAVAGVVNVITRDKFDGFQVTARVNQFTYSDQGDRNVQVMFGTPVGEKGHIVMAFGAFKQDPMSSTFDAPVLKGDRGNLRYTIASGQPGRYVVPLRDASGALRAGTGSTRTLVDPSCGQVVGSLPTDVPPATRIAAQQPLATATDCRYFFFDDNALQSELTRYQAFARGSYEFSDRLKFTGEFGYTTFETATSYTTGETISQSVAVPGHNPGNTFRATNAAGQPLFAVSSGVSAGYARDGAPVFLPSRDASGRVILTATPTVATSGIPFWEDVVLNGRLLGSQCGLPGNQLVPGECAKMRASESDNSVLSTAGFFSGRVLGDWDWSAGASYSRYRISANGTTGNGLTSELFRALDGLGGPGCQPPATGAPTPARGAGPCGYFNPFGNSALASPSGDPRANSQAIIDWVIPALNDQFESRLLEIEAHASGALIDLPAGKLGVAVGYQFRHAVLDGDYDVQRNNGNTLNLNTAADFNVSRDTHAIFAEFNAPLMDSEMGYLEVNGALRHEWIGSSLETTNPKVGVLLNTLGGKLSVRGSYGESFVAPSLFRLFGNVGGGAAVSDCARTVDPVCTGQTNLRITQITAGNPNLKPQTSENYSIGFTAKPLPDLTLSVDRWHYTFEDLITTESATAAVAADPTGARTGKVRRNATGQLSTVFVQYINAPRLLTTGVDFDITWRRDLETLGDLVLNIAGTRIQKYNITPTPGATPVKGADRTNDTPGLVGLSANPEWRVNGRATWTLGPHSVTALVRYYDDLNFSRDLAQDIDSWAPVDLSYTFSWKDNDAGWRPDMTLTVGATNVLNETAPFVPFPGFQPFIATLYDLRGRSVWARFAANF